MLQGADLDMDDIVFHCPDGDMLLHGGIGGARNDLPHRLAAADDGNADVLSARNCIPARSRRSASLSAMAMKSKRSTPIATSIVCGKRDSSSKRGCRPAKYVLKLPPVWVYFIMTLDEFEKMPVVFIHYIRGKWLTNITRDFD